MKKFFIFAMFIIAYSINVGAQTYCYKYLYTVDKETGVRGKDYISEVFITFAHNKNTCYQSDEDGIKKVRSHGFNYYNPCVTTGENEYTQTSIYNGIITYTSAIVIRCGMVTSEPRYEYILFSDDYQRLNEDRGFGKIYVYERIEMPGQEAPPSQMW